MVLSSKISFNSVKTDGTVSTYTKNAEQNAPDEQHLKSSKITFQQNLLYELFDFKQLKSSLFQLKKLAEDYNQVISLGFLDNVNAARDVFENAIFMVAEKFKKHLHVQLQELSLPEENVDLQERVKKGCVYFLEKIDELEIQLGKVDFDADNKVVKKSINDAEENFRKEVFIKKSAFKLCVDGFKPLDYLKTKANADIDFNNLKKSEASIKPTKAPAGIQHPELYQALKKWRDDLAGDHNVPVYQVLPQKC